MIDQLVGTPWRGSRALVAVYATATGRKIFRKGGYHGRTFATPREMYATLTALVLAASDHAAITAALDLPRQRPSACLPSMAGPQPRSPCCPGNFLPMALIRFLDGKQHGKTTTVDDSAISGEGRYRFRKRDLTEKGGRAYYLKAVSKKRWADKKIPEWTAALDDDAAD